MIHIEFDPSKLPPDQKKWWDGWQNKAGTATQAVIDLWTTTGKVSSKDDFDEGIWGELKAWLLQHVFHNKCAYCESNLDHQFGEAEHFRPKGGVNFRAKGSKQFTTATGLDYAGNVVNHPGYFWLAYHWRNLLPSCKACNSGPGKKNQFPVARRHVFLRALNDRQVARRLEPPRPCKKAAGFFFLDPVTLDRLEKPRLLNPFIDDPGLHLTFGMYGIEVPKSPKGEASVDVFNLKDDGLRRLRHEAQIKASTLLLTKFNVGLQEGHGYQASWEQAKADTVASLKNRNVPYLAASIDMVLNNMKQPF